MFRLKAHISVLSVSSVVIHVSIVTTEFTDFDELSRVELVEVSRVETTEIQDTATYQTHMTPKNDVSLVLLHEEMLNKEGRVVTTSVTLNDIQDLSRTAKTFGMHSFYVAHPSPAQHRLLQRLKIHWEEGFGASYNPNRKEAMSGVEVVNTLNDVIARIEFRTGHAPKLVATSARAGERRCSFTDLRKQIESSSEPYLIMLGSGWGMSPELLARADYILEPIYGPGEFNHLSVRGACSIILDRLFGR